MSKKQASVELDQQMKRFLLDETVLFIDFSLTLVYYCANKMSYLFSKTKFVSF